jgi:mersacidin/lichenicidin family type 2 lantibiotic
MSHVNVVRAWKDEEYRLSLTDAERAQLPENPAGFLELSETDLHQVSGGDFVVPATPVLYYTINFACYHTLAGCPVRYLPFAVGG